MFGEKLNHVLSKLAQIQILKQDLQEAYSENKKELEKVKKENQTLKKSVQVLELKMQNTEKKP